MSKLIVDTLQKNGKWDKQAIAFLVSFVISIILGITNTVLSYVLTITNNPTADNVFNSFMILTGAMSGVNIWNKIADSNIQRKEQQASQTTTNTNTEQI
jgi:uncharacterized protein (DUF697 family)